MNAFSSPFSVRGSEEAGVGRPVNIEAEQALLGALLLNNEVADLIVGLETEHFYEPLHGRIYDLVMRRIAEAKRADPVVLKTLLAEDEALKELGGHDYIVRLAGAAISIVAAPDYAQMIIDLAMRRRMIAALQEAQDALPSAEDPAEVIAALEAAIAGEEAGAERESGVGMRDALVGATDDINEAFKGREPIGIPLCIPSLEAVIGRARPGDYLLIGARPSMGKSAVAIEIARRATMQGTGVVYWCAEMAPRENGLRMLSATARGNGQRIAYRDAINGSISEDDFRSLIEAARDIERLPVHFIEPSIAELRRLTHEIRRHVRRFQRQGREVLVVIDYLQKIVTDGRSPYERVSQASAAMKRLAMQLRVPFLVLAQLSRGVESRDNKRPVLSDLRDSGEIEQDANTAMFLYRDEYYLERAIEADPDGDVTIANHMALDRARNKLEIIVAKQRSGPLKTVKLGFDGATNSLWELGEVVPFPRPGARQEGVES